MFTLKFYADGDNKTIDRRETLIECPHYEAIYHREGYIITTYTDTMNTGAVERHVSTTKGGPGCYNACWVQNEAGKTIAKYIASDRDISQSNTGDAAPTPSTGAR